MFIELTRKGYDHSNQTITYKKFTINVYTIADIELKSFIKLADNYDITATYIQRTSNHMFNEIVNESPEEIRELIRKEMNKQTTVISPSIWTDADGYSVVDCITTRGDGNMEKSE